MKRKFLHGKLHYALLLLSIENEKKRMKIELAKQKSMEV
jgi:hypothetical protein